MKTLRFIFALIIMVLAIEAVGTFIGSPTPVYAQGTTCDDGRVVAAPSECTIPDGCTGGGFLGFPKWHKYLKPQSYKDQTTNRDTCVPQIEGLNDVWKIAAAVIEMITRLATLIAIGFVVYGGVTYTLSQGNPDKTKQALKTIINSLVGLAIAIIATAVVSFIAGRF